MKTKDIPRAVVTAAVIALFAFAYIANPEDDMITGALIAAFSLSISYWLGSSKGSSDKQDQLDRRPTGEPSDPVHTQEEGGPL